MIESTNEQMEIGSHSEVRALMTRAVARIDPDASLQELALKLSSVGAGALAVGTTDSISGIVSERDLTRGYGRAAEDDQLRVVDIASTETLWCRPETTANDAARLMCEHGVRHLLVGDGSDDLEGIVSARDLLEALIQP